MKQLLTSRQVARAIQVSESSVKRWCDKGAIPTQYTAGGHRRIPLGGLLDFLRAGKHQLVQPEVVGLPATTGRTQRVIDRAADQMAAALVLGGEDQCRRIAFDLYLAGHRLAVIFDLVFAKAFEAIGDRWECGQLEVYQERLGCEIALRALYELRSLVAPPPTDAPLAMGGSAAGDQYHLATTMAEIVLRVEGWNAVSLGSNLPAETLAATLRERRPRLFWVSCSHLDDEDEFVRGYERLYEKFHGEVAFVVGGRALTEPVRQRMNYAAHCDTMQHLEAFAATIRSNDKS